jgi:mannan endo-1,4-beta-mannosidase
MLADHSVTVLRLMLEYSKFDWSCFERPAGRPRAAMVQLWDDIFALCEENGVRILLTPFDTFWMWIRWDRHPYAKENGGPCADRGRILICPDTRKYIKERLSFMTERWGSRGAVFAWDLWNEIHPDYAGNSADCFADFITDLSEHMGGTNTVDATLACGRLMREALRQTPPDRPFLDSFLPLIEWREFRRRNLN